MNGAWQTFDRLSTVWDRLGKLSTLEEAAMVAGLTVIVALLLIGYVFLNPLRSTNSTPEVRAYEVPYETRGLRYRARAGNQV